MLITTGETRGANKKDTTTQRGLNQPTLSMIEAKKRSINKLMPPSIKIYEKKSGTIFHPAE
ncbi:MAG: hypothetical protein JEZ14_05140 [Marinilabiliaceae bacterium]|nr:hypothetical protein [Marinilabiliaceae bacterium]